MSLIKKIFSTAYDVFPFLNRPMATCACISYLAIIVLYGLRASAFSLLILFAITLFALCIITRNKKIVVISILTIAVCASTVNEFETIKELNSLDGQVIEVELTAIEDSYDTGKVHKVTVYCNKSDSVSKYTKFSLYYFFDEDIKCGDTFSGIVKLSSLEGSDFKEYNYGNTVYMDCKLIKISEYLKSNSFFESVGNVRGYMISTLRRNFPDDISSILIALNCGDRNYLSDEFYAKVKISGLAHVMVVSGLHISIIIGLLFKLFEKFYYNRYLKCLVSALAVFLISAVCGFTLSVVRAGTMFLFFVLSPLFMRKNDSLNSLGSAVVLILYITPLSILSVGFQLSVAATLAVVWVAPFYTDLIISKLFIKNRFGKSFVSVLTVSTSAMIFTAPITINVFGTYAFLAPVSFLLVTFTVTCALSVNSLALLLSSVKGISIISKPLFFLSGLCARYVKLIVDNIGQLDFMLIESGIVAIIVFAFIMLALIAVMYLYKYYIKRIRRRFVTEVKTRGYTKRKNA